MVAIVVWSPLSAHVIVYVEPVSVTVTAVAFLPYSALIASCTSAADAVPASVAVTSAASMRPLRLTSTPSVNGPGVASPSVTVWTSAFAAAPCAVVATRRHRR